MSTLWGDFLDSWPLFGLSYTTGLLAAAMLALVGVFALARRQLFLGVVVAQSSTLGIACVLAIGTIVAEHHDLHGWPIVARILFAVITAFAAGRRSSSTAVDEPALVWVFVFAQALAVLLLAHGPHGLEEIQRMTFSTLIGADQHDLLQIGALLVPALVLALGRGRMLLLCAVEPGTARALGLPARRVRAGLSLALGLCIGVAIHTTGTLFTVSSLTLPALAARLSMRTMVGTLRVAPLIAIATTLLGFVLANGYDYPLGQVAAAVQATAVLLALPIRRLRAD